MNNTDKILDSRNLRNISISIQMRDRALLDMDIHMTVDGVEFYKSQTMNRDSFVSYFDGIFESLRREIKLYINSKIPLPAPGPLLAAEDRLNQRQAELKEETMEECNE